MLVTSFTSRNVVIPFSPGLPFPLLSTPEPSSCIVYQSSREHCNSFIHLLCDFHRVDIPDHHQSLFLAGTWTVFRKHSPGFMYSSAHTQLHVRRHLIPEDILDLIFDKAVYKLVWERPLTFLLLKTAVPRHSTISKARYWLEDVARVTSVDHLSGSLRHLSSVLSR